MKRISAHAAAALFMVVLAAAVQAADKLYLWEVKGRGSTGYLFGSIHLCRADCFPLPGEVLQALERSDAFALELDPEAPGAREQLMRQALYGEGDSLDRHLQPALVAELKGVLGRAGLPPEAILRMKPWMAGTTLTLMAAMQAGYAVDQGIDVVLLAQARARGKPVLELENADEQVASLERLPPGEQEAFVAQAVRLAGSDAIRGYVDDLVGAWRRGDADGLYRLSQSGLEDRALAQRMLEGLLEQRNRNMAQRLAALLSEGRSVFAVVGALHLAGEDSVIERLKAAGFEVRQLTRQR
jgi:uncharacterized protein